MSILFHENNIYTHRCMDNQARLLKLEVEDNGVVRYQPIEHGQIDYAYHRSNRKQIEWRSYKLKQQAGSIQPQAARALS
jgi:hypothetical protein